jgi:hypothetical protein
MLWSTTLIKISKAIVNQYTHPHHYFFNLIDMRRTECLPGYTSQVIIVNPIIQAFVFDPLVMQYRVQLAFAAVLDRPDQE